jgi:hypothetical protein
VIVISSSCVISRSIFPALSFEIGVNNELFFIGPMYALRCVPITIFLSLSLSFTTTAIGVVCCSYLIYSGRYGHPSEWGQYVPVPATPQNGNGKEVVVVVADDNDDKQSNLETTKAEKWDICMEGADLVAEMVLSPLSLSPAGYMLRHKKSFLLYYLSSPPISCTG